ncbi:MAG: dihydroorotate dehydrogenase electron transfer subunit [Bacillota bacterium]|nr:dihydroorotate dehydrogenase electron transfer subunit [Bacillota bacterium]
MKQSIFTVENNECLAKNTYELILSGDTSDITKPGQFVNIKLDGCFLRRPISVCDYDDKTLTLIYKVVGRGTEFMSKLTKCDKLDILTGLGNGYDLSKSGDTPLLIGGGAGIPPMYKLAKELIKEGKNAAVILGFNEEQELFYEDKFKELGTKVYITTADGSKGIKGFVTEAMKNISYSYFYVCGPEPMLRAVYKESIAEGQFSFEERMGCGFGACMGCSCKTKYGNKRICKDGPVLFKEEIIW